MITKIINNIRIKHLTKKFDKLSALKKQKDSIDKLKVDINNLK